MEVNAAYSPTQLGKLPEDWSVLSISELRPFITSGSRGWAPFYADNGSPFIRISNLSRENIYPNLNDLRFVSLPENDSEGARTQLRAGDVLISITADIGIIGYVTGEMPVPSYINQHIALVRFDESRISSLFVSYFLASKVPQKLFRALIDAGAKAGMNLTTVGRVRIALPPTRAEQVAIAEALSDADALIESLEQLLAKKRQIKQGAMQELLTGKKRLPGFGVRRGRRRTEVGEIPNDWEPEFVENLASITTGGRNTQDRKDDGQYPFFVRSQTVERIDSYSFDGEAVLTAGDGVGTGKIFHYIKGKFDAHQRVYRISEFNQRIDGYFFFLYFSTYFYSRIMQMTAKSSVDSVRREMIARMQIPVPSSRAEQECIAQALSDMDADITSLEAKLAKARQIKHGMMQELLTGRIRLI